MTDIERRALLGNAEAQRECAEKEILLPCPFCGNPEVKRSSAGYLFYCRKCDCHDCTKDFKAFMKNKGGEKNAAD